MLKVGDLITWRPDADNTCLDSFPKLGCLINVPQQIVRTNENLYYALPINLDVLPPEFRNDDNIMINGFAYYVSECSPYSYPECVCGAKKLGYKAKAPGHARWCVAA